MSSLSEAATEALPSQGYFPGKNVSLLEYMNPKWDASQKPSKVTTTCGVTITGRTRWLKR